MRAAILERRGPDGLRVGQFPNPEPAAGEAVMRVRASALNRVDLYMRDVGVGITHELPIVLGVEAAGEIVHVPPGGTLEVGMRVALYASRFCGDCRYCLAGDQPLCTQLRIAGEHRHGGFAEYVAMPSRCFLPLPDSVSFAAAGAASAAYGTAYRMLFGKRPVVPGETVLVVGVGGGVAVACLQLAQLAGARVIVTSSSDEKLQRALGMGAIAGINYRTELVSKRVIEIMGEGVDMVIDSSGESSWGESLRSLRRGGRIVTCGATTGSNPPVELQRMFIRQLEVYGSTGANIAETMALWTLIGSGRLDPVIDQSFELGEIDTALGALSSGRQFGKIGITVA